MIEAPCLGTVSLLLDVSVAVVRKWCPLRVRTRRGGTAAHDHDETHAHDVLAGRVVLLLLRANSCVREWCAADRSVRS
jgi:hypothetical protein